MRAADMTQVRSALSHEDVRRLTLFKWTYSLESAGFTTREAQQIVFLKWMHSTRRIQP